MNEPDWPERDDDILNSPENYRRQDFSEVQGIAHF